MNMPRNFGLAPKRPPISDEAFATWAVMITVAVVVIAASVLG